jgi:nitrous oxide reductase accessory protein NosL
MFAWHLSPGGSGSHDLWVTEYYSQEKMALKEVFLVMGSDVLGPMGKSLVPVHGREAAEQFSKDHAGVRVLETTEITLALLRELAGKPAASEATGP